jgi:hypothetical protein
VAARSDARTGSVSSVASVAAALFTATRWSRCWERALGQRIELRCERGEMSLEVPEGFSSEPWTICGRNCFRLWLGTEHASLASRASRVV